MAEVILPLSRHLSLDILGHTEKRQPQTSLIVLRNSPPVTSALVAEKKQTFDERTSLFALLSR